MSASFCQQISRVTALVLAVYCLSALAAKKESYDFCGNLLNDRLKIYKDRQVLVPPATPVAVKTGITVVMVKGIEDEQQRLTMTVLVSMQWDEPRIATLDQDCNDQSSKYVAEATKYLPWYPHFTLANSAGTVLYEEGWRYFPALVFANGTVRWIQEYQFETICILDLVLFPFDTQLCKVDISSPHYDENTLEFEVENPKLAIQLVSDQAASAPVWKIVGQNYSPLEGSPGISFKFQLERRPSFYICSLLLPTLVVNIMTAATFIVGPVFEEKAQLAQNCLLAYLLLNLVFYKYVPTSSNSQPYLVYFFTIQNFLALGCFFAVTILFRREHAAEKKEAEKLENDQDTVSHSKLVFKSILNDAKFINDIVMVIYISLVLACYVTTLIFYVLGAAQSKAKADANGFTFPQNADFSSQDD